MPVWLFEPHDPLIVRDGRPFDATPGARASSLPFPLPSTTAGAIRTLAGQDATGAFRDGDREVLIQVKCLEVRGPLLVELGDNDAVRWLAPAPADALLLDRDTDPAGVVTRKQLVPLEDEPGAESDLQGQGLAPVGTKDHTPGKVSLHAPRFWYWDQLLAWLRRADQRDEDYATAQLGHDGSPPSRITTLGHNGPLPESRTHVAIEPGSQLADEGKLFQTRGLEFARPVPPGPTTTRLATTRLALALATRNLGTELRPPTPGVAFVGGERRLSQLRVGPENLPRCPDDIINAIVRTKACRILLLTPAFFTAGIKPTWLLKHRRDVRPELVAVATSGRPQVVSGWDLAYRADDGKRGRPKPTRRLVPAGSVLFLRLQGADDAIKKWVDYHWMRSISDDDPDDAKNLDRFRVDGFGLAVLGVWGDAGNQTKRGGRSEGRRDRRK